jgi:two-component system sensor histidine kinase KdpD
MPPFFAGAAASSHCSGVLGIAPIVVEPRGIVDVSYNRLVQQKVIKSALRYAASAALVFVIVFVYHTIVKVNPTTVALTFLLGVLILSATWGLRPAVFTAIVAAAAFNYYFLPPVGTFAIADPQNWVALFAFLVTAVIASDLSERARREARNANERRRDVERLYGFSQHLLSSDNVAELLNAVPGYILDSFGGKAAAVSLPNRPDVYRSGPGTDGLELHDLQMVCMRGEPRVDAQNQVAFMPLRMGARVVGSMGISGVLLSRETLEALGSLIAIAIERAGAIEKLGRAEAARESEQLRSILLDSVTHEFRTPLTAIKASVTSLLGSPNLDPAPRHELLTVINEESDRLNRLVGEAAEMAQLDANQVELRLEPHNIEEVIEEAVRESKQLLSARPVEVRLVSDLPPVRIDSGRIKEVLMQLLENAAKYSPPEAPIYVTGEVKNGVLTISVADRGPGIDDFEQSLIFEKFYRGRNQRLRVQGTGMGLAIAKAIVEAHSGRIGVTSQLGHGSVFYFSVPVG